MTRLPACSAAALLIVVGLAAAASAQGCDASDIFGPVHQTLTTGPAPIDIAFGDFNADGIADLAAANTGAATFTAWRGLGDGTFGFATSLGASVYNSSVTFGDVTGDGVDDVLVVGDDGQILQDNGRMVVFRGNSGGGVSYLTVHALQLRTPSDAIVADVDADGTNDVLVMQEGNPFNDRFALLRGHTGGQLGAPAYTPTINLAVQLDVGDLNADGAIDVVAARAGAFGAGVQLGFGDGTFSDATTLSVFEMGGDMRLADVNNDGALDLVGVETNRHGVALGNGDGTFGTGMQVMESSVANKSSMAVGDLNGDGNLDIVSADTRWVRSLGQSDGVDTISVYFGNGDGTFEMPATYPTQSQPTCVAIADVDGDGDLDVAYSCRGSNSIQIRLNQCVVRPAIVQHPAPLTMVDAGQTVQLSVVIGAVGRPPFAYQWRRHGQALEDGAGITGSRSDTLTITAAATSDTDTYDVVITNGGGAVTSHAGVVAVRQPCLADLNGDDVLDFFDVQAYLNAFSAGCP